MLSLYVALVLCFAGVGYGRRSPNADLVELYYKYGPEAGRYSNNLLEDALLDVPGLITKYGYPVEVHHVVTEDGYILEMQRIPHGRDDLHKPQRPVALVMHGLFSSAADWVVLGPGSALGYLLADQGYDVWLGNARGTFYSRNHTTHDPDTSSDFWQFSWEEIGTRDLPAMIDHALQVTGRPRLHYIGHSQGTTAFWTMASLRPEYNDKIITMQALAPVAFFEFNRNPMFFVLANHARNIERLLRLLGYNELLPNSPLFTSMGQKYCSDEALTQPLCMNVLFLVAGTSRDMLNATMLPLKLAHTPAGSSARQLLHYGQHIRQDFFRRYDHGTAGNWRAYRSFTPPSYDLNKITSNVYLHYADDDVFAHQMDVRRLSESLGGTVSLVRVPHALFSHLDFMWGSWAKPLVYDRVVDIMKLEGDD